MFSMDWFLRPRSAQRIEQSAPQDSLWRETSLSLAGSMQQLCFLCDELLGMVESENSTPEAQPILRTLPGRIEAIRQDAACIAADAASHHKAVTAHPAPADPYSLETLRRLMTQDAR